MNDHDQKTVKLAVGEYCEAKLEKLAIQDELPKTKRAFRANHFSDDIRDGFKLLRESSSLCDCTLIAQDAQFPVHKSLLASVSDYFRAMFCSGMREATSSAVSLQGISADGLRKIVDFIYSGEVQIGMEDVEEILDAATHLQMRHIVNFCTEFLIEQVSRFAAI
jgi:hypothetical protein